jgi:hypothetical protein
MIKKKQEDKDRIAKQEATERQLSSTAARQNDIAQGVTRTAPPGVKPDTTVGTGGMSATERQMFVDFLGL